MIKDFYESPLNSRYASEEMQRIFSERSKVTLWRRLWAALAESQRELGLKISAEQVQELKAHTEDIDFDAAIKFEAETRHDVMSHVRTYAAACPKAAGIIHLGATSCYVGDNADLIQMREGMQLIRRELVQLLRGLYDFCEKHKDTPVLAYTHFQPAQPTTMGKRAALWAADVLSDLSDLEYVLSGIKFAGCKGATGTAASFLQLFCGDAEKVKELEYKIAGKMGFSDVYPVGGQTYSRKIDSRILSVLSGIAQSAAKFSNDFRLMSHLKEVSEPFEPGQIGSSAMAYKRNPMRSERIGSLARYLITDALNPALTAAGQWLERTLDDSANRRLSIPEAFLCCDAILSLYINIISGARVYPKMAEKHIKDELPFLAAEKILMHCVSRGGDRQALHELLRRYSVEAGQNVMDGGENTLVRLIASDKTFGLSEKELSQILYGADYTGCAKRQTEDFLSGHIAPVLEKYKDLPGAGSGIKV